MNLNKMPIEKTPGIYSKISLPVDYQSIKSKLCTFCYSARRSTQVKRAISKQTNKQKRKKKKKEREERKKKNKQWLEEIDWAPKLRASVPSYVLPTTFAA